MSARSLPAHPSLRHLKAEAKQLHKAVARGDADAAERARANLRRLSHGDSVDDVTLQEAQHVLGREYGFLDWQGLAAAAEFTFENLANLSDEDVHRLLREVDQKDLVVALKLATDSLIQHILTGMTERARNFIVDEMEFLGPMPEAEILEVQARILQEVRQLAMSGSIGWPPGADTPPPKPGTEPELDPALAAALGRKLAAFTPAEIRNLVHALSARIQAHGLLALEVAATSAADGFVREALQLAADGTEPALLEDILLTRTRAMLQSLDNRLRMTIEGCVSLRHGDNPRIVIHKLQSIYSTDFDKEIWSEQGTVEKLQQCLREEPVSTLNLDGFTELFGNLAHIARRQGYAALTEVLDDVDDDFLRAGLQQVADDVEVDALIKDLESRMPAALSVCGDCYQLFTAGCTAVQEGKTGADLDARME